MKKKLIDAPRLCSCGDHGFISLTKGYLAIFDPQDSELVATCSKWWAMVRNKTVYAMTTEYPSKKNTRMHRKIINPPGDIEVDHRNGCGLDNRRRNLRSATHSQNQRNRTPSVSGFSKFLGVSIDKRSMPPVWTASIQADGKLRMIGRFQDETLAAIAYDDAAAQTHGEFARLNFPRNKNAAAPE